MFNFLNVLLWEKEIETPERENFLLELMGKQDPEKRVKVQQRKNQSN